MRVKRPILSTIFNEFYTFGHVSVTYIHIVLRAMCLYQRVMRISESKEGTFALNSH